MEEYKIMLENHRISTQDIAYFEHFYVLSILEHADYSYKIEKFCQNDLNLFNKIKESLPYIISVIKEMVELCAKK